MAHKVSNILNVSQQTVIVVTTMLIVGQIFVNPTLCETVETEEQDDSLPKQLKDTGTKDDAGTKPKDSLDSFKDLALTPYSDMEMGTGETIVVDCGVYTAGKSGIIIHWFRPDGSKIDNTDDRIHLTNSTKNHPQDTSLAAYSVKTLNITNLKKNDSGNYTCHAEKLSTDGNETTVEKSIKITVESSDVLCGFETTLCGWNDTHVENDNATTSWRHHNGDDQLTIEMTKLRHDHTYGASKHEGYLLSVDAQRDSIDKPTSLGLISPVQMQHNAEKCFLFWHICFGNVDEFNLAQHFHSPAFNDTKLDATEPLIVPHQDREWHVTRVKLPPTSVPYQILLEVKLCKEAPCKAKVALDDFRMLPTSCSNVASPVDKPLKVRLVNGSSEREGRLEVLHDGKWGTVCSENFGKNDARVVCRMLKFGNLSAENVDFKRNATFGRGESDKSNGDYMIWVEKLACTGDEQDLGSCMSKNETWGDHSCNHTRDVAVICKEENKTAGEPVEPLKPTIPAVQSSSTSTSSSTASSTTASTSTTPAPTSTPKPAPTPTTTLAPAPVQTKPTKSSKQEPSSTTTTVSTTTTTDPYQTEGVVSTTGLPLSHSSSSGSHTGAAVGIIVSLIIIAPVSGIYCYKRKKYGHKSKYIVFSNPKYHKDNLPGNDISMDSPLTSSSLSFLA